MIAGLCNINVELTSRCNKNCWMCGRRERDRLGLSSPYGDMEFSIVEKLAAEVPPGIMIQLHNNGEPLLYPEFGRAVRLFRDRGCVTSIVSNGKLLAQKHDEIIDNLDILSISVIEADPEADDQFSVLEAFLQVKGDKKPYTTLRFVGDVDEERYEPLGLLHISRTLHAPKGSVEYKCAPTIPEHGVCLDFLTHLAVDRHGNVSVCVRFDPGGELVLGNIRDSTLEELWNCPKRKWMKELHVSGRRWEIGYCGDMCEYWGVPTSNRKVENNG